MSAILHDLRTAVRALSRRPLFAVGAVLTLALGVGANSAIFSVVDAVLLDPLPYAEPDGLVMVWTQRDDDPSRRGVMSQPDIQDLAERAPSLESLTGYSTSTMVLTGAGDPEILEVARTSGGLLSTFRIAPALGRDLRADEWGGESARVVLVSHGFWQGRLAGGEDVVGRTLVLDAVPHEIVGVAPEGFDFPERTQVWVPRRISLEGCGRGCHTWNAIGRMASRTSLDALQTEVTGIAHSLAESFPESNFGKGFQVLRLRDDMVRDVRAGLWIVLGAVGAVLLIACANVANLLLVRATSRRGEVAVRAALGASRARLVSHIMVESAVLAALGGAAGLGLAWVGVEVLATISAGTIPRVERIGIDGSVLLFTVGVTALVTVLFGLAPAVHLGRVPLAANLVQGGRGAAGSGRSGRARSLLVAAEVGLSVVLLIATGLLLRTFAELNTVELGFETRETTRFTLALPSVAYGDLGEVRTFYRSLEARLAALPGVESVGSVYGAPFGRGHTSGDVLVEGREEPAPGAEIGAAIRSVSPDYLATARIPLRRGRALLDSDDVDAVPVGVVNQAFVDRVFPGEEPLGQRVRITVDQGYGSPVWEIVGVVGNVRTRSLTREATPEIFVPHGLFGPGFMTVTIRSAPGAAPGLEVLRSEVQSLDPNLPLQNLERLEEAIERQVAPTRFYMVLLALFAGLAVVLAAIGLYGVIAYLVAQRTREFGVRVALGAAREDILKMVMGQGLRPAAVGLGVGLVVALAGARVLESILYGVQPRDPLTFLGASILILLVTALATTAPAFRATRVDPVEALRTD